MPELRPPVGADDHIQGPTDAAVMLLEYGDYQCWYSIEAHLVVMRLLETLGDDLAFSYRHFPIIDRHPRAVPAAVAAEAAADQGLFWPYHDQLYHRRGELSDRDLADNAALVGLNAERFASGIRSGRCASKVEADRVSGEESGVTGTPTFFINGRQFTGRSDYRTMFDSIVMEIQHRR
jgi:protein-disulfide isomerase